MGGMAEPKELETDPLQLKDAGNAAFKGGNWEEALSCYTKALDLNIEETEKAAASNIGNLSVKERATDCALFLCIR